MILCSEDQCVSSPDVGELSPEGPQPPLILLQQLLSASTQPSPIKAIFHRQELEVRDRIYTSLTIYFTFGKFNGKQSIANNSYSCNFCFIIIYNYIV